MESQSNTPQQQEQSSALTGYCLKTKQKNVPMQDAVISRTSRGGYIAQGHDGNGNKMSAMLGKDKAEAAVATGNATWSPDIEKPNA